MGAVQISYCTIVTKNEVQAPHGAAEHEKKALRRAHNARRQPIWRRVARYGALRAVGGKRRSVGRSALFERVSAWFYGDAGGYVLSLPELNWRYAIMQFFTLGCL